jgi:hypothetical protein
LVSHREGVYHSEPSSLAIVWVEALFLILPHWQQFVLAQLSKSLDQVQVTLRIVASGTRGAAQPTRQNPSHHQFSSTYFRTELKTTNQISPLNPRDYKSSNFAKE